MPTTQTDKWAFKAKWVITLDNTMHNDESI